MASLPVRPHRVNARRIRCQADLNSFPLGELEETTGTPPYYVDEDYPAGHGITEPLPEWSNWRGSESSTLENDVYVWCYALIVVHARNEWMNEWMNECVIVLSIFGVFISCQNFVDIFIYMSHVILLSVWHDILTVNDIWCTCYKSHAYPIFRVRKKWI